MQTRLVNAKKSPAPPSTAVAASTRNASEVSRLLSWGTTPNVAVATLGATAALFTSLRLCVITHQTRPSRSPGAQRDGQDDARTQGVVVLTQTVCRRNTCLQSQHIDLSSLGSIKGVGNGGHDDIYCISSTPTEFSSQASVQEENSNSKTSNKIASLVKINTT